MRIFVAAIGAVLLWCQPAWALLDQNQGQVQDQDQVQVQLQGQGQDQGQDQYQDQAAIAAQAQAQGKSTVAAGTQKVIVPRQHRNAPNVSVQTAPGQSGFGVSFPGGSFTGVRTDVVDRAAKYLDMCGINCDTDYAVAQAKKSLESCYFGGPVGQILSIVPMLNLENDGGPFCF